MRVTTSQLGELGSLPGGMVPQVHCAPTLKLVLHYTSRSGGIGANSKACGRLQLAQCSKPFCAQSEEGCAFTKTLLEGIPAFTYSALVWGFQNIRLIISTVLAFKFQGFSWNWWVFFPTPFCFISLSLPQGARLQVMTA